jgi:SAM-dependent methyltransferase
MIREHFNPTLGLELEPYIGIGDLVAVHHLIRYRWACKLIEDRGPARVLDLGCGGGYGTDMIAAVIPESTVVGLDYDTTAVAEASRRYTRANLRFLRGDVSIGLPDGALFDAVVCFDVIEHLVHREIVMQNIVSSLGPDGFLLISTPIREENQLNPAWEHHRIEYSGISLFDFLSRYFEKIRRPEDGGLPFSEVIAAVNRGDILERLKAGRLGQLRDETEVYRLEMNPVMCEGPIRKNGF